MKKSPIWKPSREEFIQIIKNSSSFRQILDHFGFGSSPGNYRTLKERIREERIDVSELEVRRLEFMKSQLTSVHQFNSIPLAEILVKNSTYNSPNLKKRLLKEGLLRNECYLCAQQPFWNGMPLVLHLDHINGDNRDNRLSNLRILCPNCHTQTDTYTGKQTKKVRNCNGCGKQITKDSKTGHCSPCANKISGNLRDYVPTRKVERPSKEELFAQIKTIGYLQTGKKYNVSDNAIRKWCKAYGLPQRTKDLATFSLQN